MHPQSLLRTQKSQDCKIEYENQVQDNPLYVQSRFATVSLVRRLFIRRTFPISRRQVRTFMFLQKSWLFKKIGSIFQLLSGRFSSYQSLFLAKSQVIFEQIFLISELIDSKLDRTLYSAITSLSSFLPLGSPIKPVAPPSKKIGLIPKQQCSRAIMMIETKLPRCKDSAVGSYPQQALKIEFLLSFVIFYFSVVIKLGQLSNQEVC